MYTLYTVIILLGVYTAVVLTKPLENKDIFAPTGELFNPVQKSVTSVPGRTGTRQRQRRQADEECEKLQLCMLHARSRHNFFAAYEQYFVNKENARLWDHHTRSMIECHRRFGNCFR